MISQHYFPRLKSHTKSKSRLPRPILFVQVWRKLSERPLTPRQDPRLLRFDSRQPVSWRAFFIRLLARIFRYLTRPALPVHDHNGDLVGD